MGDRCSSDAEEENETQVTLSSPAFLYPPVLSLSPLLLPFGSLPLLALTWHFFLLELFFDTL